MKLFFPPNSMVKYFDYFSYLIWKNYHLYWDFVSKSWIEWICIFFTFLSKNNYFLFCLSVDPILNDGLMKTCPLLLMLCPRRKCLACNEAFLNESAFQDHKLSMRHKRNFYAYFFKEHRYVIDKIRKISNMGPSINDATHFLKFLTPSSPVTHLTK